MGAPRLTGLLLAGSALVLPSYAAAQDSSGQRSSNSDDIVITATKRAQSLQDVPVSVAVATAQEIERSHIVDLKDLQSIVPSLRVDQHQNSGATNFVIRGFGNGSDNDGIEGSVGVFIDGVYRSRSAAALDDLLEIERVEVLRGPQSTLFGKNVSAGAVNIVTKRPSFDWGGRAEVSVGNYGLINPKATITGPISDKVAFRLSGSLNERSGYFKNIVTGRDTNNLDRGSLRGELLIEPSSNISIRIIADYSRINEYCCGQTAATAGGASAIIRSLGFQIGEPSREFSYLIVPNDDSINRISGKGISAQIDWDLGAAKLTSITAYRNQKNATSGDVEYTSADIATLVASNDIRTFTQEIRLASTGSGPFSWLIGGFYDRERLRSDRNISYGTDARRFVDALSGGFIGVLESVQGVPAGTYFAPGLALIDNYRMRQESYSIFGQADYKIGRLTLTAGGAFLHDRKAAVSNVTLLDKFSLLNLDAIPPFNALDPLQFFYGDTPNHAPVNFPNANETGILTGSKFTYTLRAAYNLGPVNAYLSYSTGWKAGAFNLSSNSRPPSVAGIRRTTDPENVGVYEAGLKAKFKGGFLNVAVFKETVEGFQANAFNGLNFSLINAGRESVRGVEVDGAYAPVPWLSFTGAVTYLDPRFDSFTGAPCVAFDTVRCAPDPVTGRIPATRDLSGERPAGIPSWTGSATATLSHQFGNRWSGFLRGEYQYISKAALTDAPGNLTSYGGSVVNASVALTNDAAKLGVMFWVRNLTKDAYPTAVFPATLQAGSYSIFPNQPRTYGVTFSKAF